MFIGDHSCERKAKKARLDITQNYDAGLTRWEALKQILSIRVLCDRLKGPGLCISSLLSVQMQASSMGVMTSGQVALQLRQTLRCGQKGFPGDPTPHIKTLNTSLRGTWVAHFHFYFRGHIFVSPPCSTSSWIQESVEWTLLVIRCKAKKPNLTTIQ